jgi:hypothetical protein
MTYDEYITQGPPEGCPICDGPVPDGHRAGRPCRDCREERGADPDDDYTTMPDPWPGTEEIRR